MTSTKGLNSTDKRALGKLVDNDFAALKVELTQFADEVLAERLEACRKANAAAVREAEQARKRYIATVQGAVDALQSNADLDVTIDAYDLRDVLNPRVTSKAATQSEQDIREQTRRDLNKALATLERERLASQKQVLTAGIGDEAKSVLDSIPSAKDLMRRAGLSGIRTAVQA